MIFRATIKTDTFTRSMGGSIQGWLSPGDRVDIQRTANGRGYFEVASLVTNVLCGALWVDMRDMEAVSELPTAGTFVGMHDFPPVDFWVDDNQRGWVLHTIAHGESLPTEAMRDHRVHGGRVCIRVNWGYGETVPRNPDDWPRFVAWAVGVVVANAAHIDAVQIGNEPDIELQGLPPAHLAEVHNRIASQLVARAPHILISPAPLGWLMAINGAHPREYFSALWAAIPPACRRIAVLHAYRHGAYGDPNQTFTDWPLTGSFYNERSIENQIAEHHAIGFDGPFLIGEWNYGAPEREGEPDAWQQNDNGATLGILRYFKSLNAPIVGACAFRWKRDTIHGRSYGINGKTETIARLQDAQRVLN